MYSLVSFHRQSYETLNFKECSSCLLALLSCPVELGAIEVRLNTIHLNIIFQDYLDLPVIGGDSASENESDEKSESG